MSSYRLWLQSVSNRLAGQWRRLIRRRQARSLWWCEWFGLEPEAARVLEVLYERRGGLVATTDLSAELGLEAIPLRRALDALSEALDEGALDAPPVALRLSTAGMAECRAALEAAR